MAESKFRFVSGSSATGFVSSALHIQHNNTFVQDSADNLDYADFDGNVFEYEPTGIEEGDLIVFPTSLAHYVPVNRSDVERRILSMNMN